MVQEHRYKHIGISSRSEDLGPGFLHYFAALVSGASSSSQIFRN
jgi:hypothetical protein